MIPPVVNNFIGGSTNQEVVDIATKLSEHNISPIINHLGEHHQSKEEVRESKQRYINLIQQLPNSRQNKQKASVSIKPSQMGLEQSTEFFKQNVEEILQQTSQSNLFLWIDMEKAQSIDQTITVYKYLLENVSENVGICLQANLSRTKKDLIQLPINSSVRIVKGAYKPPNKQKISTSVESHYQIIVKHALNKFTNVVAIGTHDKKLIEKITQSQNITHPKQFQIQMLRGVREEYQKELAKEYQVAQYIPYGKEWMPYTYRRIKERPANIILLTKSTIQHILH